MVFILLLPITCFMYMRSDICHVESSILWEDFDIIFVFSSDTSDKLCTITTMTCTANSEHQAVKSADICCILSRSKCT